ncbi:MAG TPA: GGDEF domain-containing protein [Xanthobacteraceae bacterium]
MELDVKTMFVVTIAVTVILGCLLIYAWYQHRKIPALAWWGWAHMVASTGVYLIGLRGNVSDFWSIEISNALLFVAAGMTWTGARLFDGNRFSLVGTFGGAAAWLLAAHTTKFMSAAHGPVVFSSMIIALYTFAAAIEFWRGREENLLSRLPLVVLLSMHGTLYFARVPLALLFPGGKSEAFFSAAWFGVIGLESLLYMIATAFILLAMAKERTEMEHKVAATIDPLTGIANRRAFLETTVRALKQRWRAPQPVSALLFDLDRFKSINDRYGHAVGDRVIRNFADIAVMELRSTDLVGRLGGEEFGALLFGAEASSAAATAERIRQSFAATAPAMGEGAIGVSVSIGVASVSADEETDIESLLTRADEALYVAKARGRNRIEVVDGYAGRGLGTARSGRNALATVASPSVLPLAEDEGVALPLAR